MSRPQQHRHQKRKDSIRFLVFLAFSSIQTGRKVFSASAMTVWLFIRKQLCCFRICLMLSVVFPASDSRLLRGYASGHKISIYTRTLQFWLPPLFGNAAHKCFCRMLPNAGHPCIQGIYVDSKLPCNLCRWYY